ncbi:MAG TPA: hypothetical protein VMW10_01825, partial [Alphaproteobacteria bacterium]|nr:hypothetical protein [Alphaproteobacteria bacterium]
YINGDGEESYQALFYGWPPDDSFKWITGSVVTLLGFGMPAIALLADDTLYFGFRLTHNFKTFISKYFFQKKTRTDSDAEKWRSEIVEELRALERIFSRLSDKDSFDAAVQFLGPLLMAEKGEERLSSAIKIVEVLNTLKKLHAYFARHCSEDKEPVHKPLQSVFSTCVDWGLPLIATWGRSVIFIYVISHVLIELGLEEGTTNEALSIVVGGVIASAIQLNYEAQAVHYVLNQVCRLPHHVKGLFYQLYVSCLKRPYLWITSLLLGMSIYDYPTASSLRGRSEAAAIQAFDIISETESTESSSIKQKLTTTILALHNYFAGLWMTGPFIVVGFYGATKGWAMGKQLACLIPSFLSGFLGNAMTFQESEENLIGFVKSLDLTANANIRAQQRKRVVNIVRGYREIFEKLRPEILANLKALLDQENAEDQNDPQVKRFTEDFKSPLSRYKREIMFSQVSHLEEVPKESPLKTKQFLSYINEFLVQNKITFLRALIGGIGGVLITSMYAPISININIPYGIAGIIPKNIILYIMELIGNDAFYYYDYENSGYNIFVNFNFFLMFYWELDGLSRNGKVLSELRVRAPCDFEEKQENIKKILNISTRILSYGIASLPSLFAVYFLLKGQTLHIVDIDEQDNKNAGYDKFEEEIRSTYAQFGYSAPFLFLNSLVFYGSRLCAYTERIIDKLFSRPIDRSFPSPAERTRLQFCKEFKDMKWGISRLKDDDEKLHTIHQQVFGQPFLDQAGTQEERDKAQVAEALKTLWVLRQTHAQHREEMQDPEPEAARKTFCNIIGWGLPLFATFGRSFIFWYVFNDLLKIMGLSDETTQIVLPFIAALIASLVQGSTEVEGTKKAMYDLTFGKKVGEDTSQGWVRKTFRRLGKLQNYFMAALDTTPYIAISMIATSDWPQWLQLATLIPAGLADFFKNVLKFNQSIGDAALFVDRVAAKISYPTATQKRNQLIGLMRRYRKMFKKLHPDILMKLDEMLASVAAGPQNENPMEEIFRDGNGSGPELNEEEYHLYDEDDPQEKEKEAQKEKEEVKKKVKTSQYSSRSNASEEKTKRKKTQTTGPSKSRKRWTSYTK